MTILLSSHILSELHQLATSYGILHNGQLLEQLTAEELDARCSKYLLVRTDNDRRAVDILRKMFPEAICQATVEGLRLFPVRKRGSSDSFRCANGEWLARAGTGSAQRRAGGIFHGLGGR